MDILSNFNGWLEQKAKDYGISRDFFQGNISPNRTVFGFGLFLASEFNRLDTTAANIIAFICLSLQY